MAEYKRMLQVEGKQDGIPVVLALQRRLDVLPIFHTVSWRTRYASGSNRRFYWSKEGLCWKLSVELALKLLEEAQAKGMLAEQFDDKYERFGGGLPTFIDSNDATAEQRAELWPEITRGGQEPDWGARPGFVVGTEYGGLWRKIMLVNTAAGWVTFRSCTKDGDYRPLLHLPSSSKWHMDNAMQDASTAVMRHFLEFLRRLP